MNHKNEVKRVACLYRVSTMKQVYDGDEIPVQKAEALKYIERNTGWKLVKEYEEPGISAYKKTAAQRDILQEALSDARAKRFDILLIYKSDRLCRISDEYNLTIKDFGKNDVEVWSITEGNITIEKFEDNLTSYVRGYNNEIESRKISDRTDSAHRQMVIDGIERGGALCYGYEYFKNGRFGGKDKHKRKELYDIKINEAEAEIIRLIFSLYASKGYGGARIAKELNQKGIPTRENKKWQGQNINRLLKNPRYAGFDCYYKTSKKKDVKSYRQRKEDWILSPQKRELQIIDDDTWTRSQAQIQERANAMIEKKPQYPRKGELLFAGLIRCGHCGHMLREMPLKKTWRRKDGSVGEKKIYKYRCYNKTAGGGCSGQTEYTKKKIEDIIMKEVYRFIDNLGRFDLSEDYSKKALAEIRKINKLIESQKCSLSAAEHEKIVLEAEIVKAIVGSSNFSADQLSSALKGKDSQIQELNSEILKSEGRISELKLQNEDFKRVRILSQTFRTAFDEMEIDDKKMVLKEIIDSIYIWRDKVEINMKINISHLSEHLADLKTPISGGKRSTGIIKDHILTQFEK